METGNMDPKIKLWTLLLFGLRALIMVMEEEEENAMSRSRTVRLLFRRFRQRLQIRQRTRSRARCLPIRLAETSGYRRWWVYPCSTEWWQNGVSWKREELLDLLALWGEQRVQESIRQSHRMMETYKEIAREMTARGHSRSATECRNKNKALRAGYKRVLLHNNTSGNDRITCLYYNELHNILKGYPNVKTRRAADSYNLPANPPAPHRVAMAVPSTPAEGSEELFTMVLEPIEGGFIRWDDVAASESVPVEEASQFQDTDATNIGSPRESGPSTSTLDDDDEASNDGDGDTNDVDPGAIMAELTPVERLRLIRARKKHVTAVQRVGDQFLKAAAREQEIYLEASRREHDGFMHEFRAYRQEEREARESRGEILRSTLQVLSDIAKAIIQPSVPGAGEPSRETSASYPGRQPSGEVCPGNSQTEMSLSSQAPKPAGRKPVIRACPKKKIPFSP